MIICIQVTVDAAKNKKSIEERSFKYQKKVVSYNIIQIDNNSTIGGHFEYKRKV